MSLTPVIRNATPADVPAILQMVAELAEFEKNSPICWI